MADPTKAQIIAAIARARRIVEGYGKAVSVMIPEPELEAFVIDVLVAALNVDPEQPFAPIKDS